MAAITYRRLNTLEEFFACETLQKDTWGFADLSVVPAHLLITFEKRGGIVVGAFDQVQLIGFVYGFVGFQYGMPTHNSVMSAVRPEYRNRGIASQLKLAQRSQALKQGFSLMTWTFDPLQSLNAYFNLSKLGVIVREYFPNLYGTFRDEINKHMPTDRFGVEWWLDRPRVKSYLETTPAAQALPVPDNGPQLGSEGLLLPGKPPPLGASPLHFGIPLSIDELKQKDLNAAMQWRHHVRDWFQAAFAAHYLVHDFAVDRQRKLGVYTLSQVDASDLLNEVL